MDNIDIDKEYNHVSSLVCTVLCAANETAYIALFNAMSLLKKSKYYKFGTKKYLNETDKSYDSYIKTMESLMQDRNQLWADYLDGIENRMKPHVDMLYYSIKQEMDKNKEVDTDIMAWVETARTLLEYAVCLFKSFFDEEEKKNGVNLSRYFEHVNMKNTYNLWQSLCGTIKSKVKTVVNLNDSDNCTNAFKIIEANLTSEKLINESGIAAIKRNPEIRKNFTDKKLHIKTKEEMEVDRLRTKYKVV